MKFRTKGIVSGSIIAIFILTLLYAFIEYWCLPIFIWVLAIYLIAIIIRSQNYILLDDEWVQQVKCNIFFRKKCISIPYKDIKDIELTTNNNLSQENVWNHYISSSLWKKIQIWKIFHFNKFKSILKDKIDWKSVNISTSTNDYLEYIDKNSPDYFPLIGGQKIRIEIILGIISLGYIFTELYIKEFDFKSFKLWPDIFFFTPIILLLIFVGVKLYNSINKRPFLMVWEDSLIVWEYHKLKYNVQKIPYSNIKWVEIGLLNIHYGLSCYITLKNKQEEKEIQWLKDWKAFIEALKRKWIDVNYIQNDSTIINF